VYVYVCICWFVSVCILILCVFVCVTGARVHLLRCVYVFVASRVLRVCISALRACVYMTVCCVCVCVYDCDCAVTA